ncbi:MAG: DUF2067 family protein [Desulfurococcales archaeon]|nr:DUF2067 family protein [Desulfurococcales archaeon]
MELAEYLSRVKGFKAFLTSLRVKQHSVEITLYGTKGEIALARRALLNAYKDWRALRAPLKRTYSISLKTLMRYVGGPFPVEALEEVLRLEGHGVKLSGGTIEVTSGVPRDRIIETASQLSSLLKDLVRVKPKASRALKQLVVSYSYLKGVDVEDALKELSSKGYIREDDVKSVPAGEWRSLLRKSLGEKVGTRDEG